MKHIFMLATLLITTPLFARGHILKCLGEEEKRFHLKKDTGPVYELNQKLISEMVQIPKLQLNNEDYLTICTGEKFSESWKLLELSIKKGKELFVFPASMAGMQKEMAQGMVDDYVESTREILLNFINQIQMISPTPTCLKEQIPELNDFFIEIKYLQEDVDLKQIFEGKDQKIFEKLKNYPLAFEKCRADLKKKARSKSTAEPKKP